MIKVLTNNTSSLSILLNDSKIHEQRNKYTEVDIVLLHEGPINDIQQYDSQMIPIVGVPYRFNKIEQSIILDNLGISSPKSFFNRQTYTPISNTGEFDAYVDIDTFIIKPILGARGYGVKLIDRKNFLDLLHFPDKRKDILRDEIAYINDNSEYDNNSYLLTEVSYIIQEKIDIKREFRLLYSITGDHLIYERVKSNKDELCANLSKGAIGMLVDKVTESFLLNAIGEQLNTLVNRYKYPWLSVDVYIDREDNVGVIEFQMEFAYDGFKPKDVKKLLRGSVLHFLK